MKKNKKAAYLDSQFPESRYSVTKAIGNMRKDLIVDCSWEQVIYKVMKLKKKK